MKFIKQTIITLVAVLAVSFATDALAAGKASYARRPVDWYLGAHVNDANYTGNSYFKHGVSVRATLDKSPARSHLKPGDIITYVNNRRIDDIWSFDRALRKSNGVVKAKVVRQGKTLEVTIQLEPDFARRPVIAIKH